MSRAAFGIRYVLGPEGALAGALGQRRLGGTQRPTD